MEMLKEYSKKFGITVINDMRETRESSERSIVFPNGWVASIVDNSKPEKNAKYSVAMCDYNGYFDWEILNNYGADKGCIYCNTELEILVACETIRRLDKLKDIDITKIWVFEFEDVKSGGFIIADTEEDAWYKLSLDKNISIDSLKCFAYITSLTSLLDSNKNIYELY